MYVLLDSAAVQEFQPPARAKQHKQQASSRDDLEMSMADFEEGKSGEVGDGLTSKNSSNNGINDEEDDDDDEEVH
jgi:hypothetical protein